MTSGSPMALLVFARLGQCAVFPHAFCRAGGHACRIPDYAPQFADFNMLIAWGFAFGLSQLLFVWGVIKCIRSQASDRHGRGRGAGMDALSPSLSQFPDSTGYPVGRALGGHMTQVSHAPAQKTGLVVLVMFGFAFALVPLYDVFCRITGPNGKTSDQAASTERAVIDSKRSIQIEFLAHADTRMPWEFSGETARLSVRPGR